MSHELLLAIVPPVSDTTLLPATAEGVPPQALLKLVTAAIVKPAGNVSVNAAAVAVFPPPALSLKVMVSFEMVPAGMLEGENALPIDTELFVPTTWKVPDAAAKVLAPPVSV